MLAFVRSLVADGGRLLLATPNALALTKRVKMVIGRHPYERIRINNTNPGHFRESSVRELTQFATTAGFTVEHRQINFCVDAVYAPKGIVHDHKRPLLGTAKNIVYRMIPEPLRENVTMILRADRPAADPFAASAR